MSPGLDRGLHPRTTQRSAVSPKFFAEFCTPRWAHDAFECCCWLSLMATYLEYKLGFCVHLDHVAMINVDHSYTTSMESRDNLHSARKPKGYVKLANFMVKRDHVILAKYRELAIRDLLYLQAELCDIEYRLKDQEHADANCADERRYHDREWWLLQSAEERGLGGEHWQLVLSMREKLREYYSAVEQYRSMDLIPAPSERRRETLHAYITSESMGGDCEFLGRDLGGYAPHPSLFDASRLEDLLSLGGEPNEDDFVSRALMGPALQLFNSMWKYVKVRVNLALHFLGVLSL